MELTQLQTEAVDLRRLALPPGHDEGITQVILESIGGVTYHLSNELGTKLSAGGILTPVMMEVGTEILPDEPDVFDHALVPVFTILAMKNWILERRRFGRLGASSVVADTIRPGDVLKANGAESRPILLAWAVQ